MTGAIRAGERVVATAADLAATATAELSPLVPYLPAALTRDMTGGSGLPAAWAGITVVNADVLAAILRLEEDVPAAVRAASLAAGAPFRPSAASAAWSSRSSRVTCPVSVMSRSFRCRCGPAGLSACHTVPGRPGRRSSCPGCHG